MAAQDDQKKAAAREAAKYVEDGMRLGLGTGSTVAHFLDAVAERIQTDKIAVTCAATSVATERRAQELGIRVEPLDGMLDLAVDGADEVEFGTLHLIKGQGGALLREKQIAQSTHRFLVIADEGKLVDRLGEKSTLPVEIVAFAPERTSGRIAELGLGTTLRKGKDGKDYVTDNGNLIVDCAIPARRDCVALDASLKTIAGVLETGLFTAGCAGAILGYRDGSVRHFEGEQFARVGVAPAIETLRRLRLPRPARKPIIAVMGVSASGKSTIGAMLAGCLDVPFIDGDDLHPQRNRDKMRSGQALNDDDRMPWLHRIAAEMNTWQRNGSGGVMVSSLLTRRYRDLVRGGLDRLVLVHLEGDRGLLAARSEARHGHFMPPALLESQFETLEPPGTDESVIGVRVDASPIEIINMVMHRLAVLA